MLFSSLRSELWRNVLLEMGETPPASLLPALITCPLCHDPSCHVYRTVATQWEWTYCEGCGFTGDIIELAASVWKLDLTSCLLRLSIAGAIPAGLTEASELTRYLKEIEKQHIAAQFWKAACQPRDTHYGHVLQDHKLDGLLDSTRWNKLAPQLVGTASPAALKELHLRLGYQDTRNRVRFVAGDQTEPAAIIPYYDAPGHFCGFGLVDRAQERQRLKYLPLSTKHPVYGLTQFSNLLAKPHPLLGERLFVFTDPVLALRMQMQWLQAQATPLPIVSSYVAKDCWSTGVWGNLYPRELIVWGEHELLENMSQAIACGGRLLLQTLSRERQHAALPLDWLRYLIKHAQPWDQLLIKKLQAANDPLAMQIMLGLGLSVTERNNFLNKTKPALRTRMLKLFNATGNQQQVIMKNRTIVNRPDGWYIKTENMERICNASIYLDAVVNMPSGKSYYRGRVVHEGETYPFLENMAHVQRDGLFRRAASLLLLQNKQLQFSQSWNTAAEFIAQQFHPPEVVKGVDAVGWDSWAKNFRFPKFIMDLDGRARTDNHGLFTDPQTPCQQLRPPAILIHHEIESVAKLADGASSLLWATLAAVMTNVLSRPLNDVPVGVGVLANDKLYQLVSKIATAAGCQVVSYKGGRHVENFEQSLTAHHWPCLVPTHVPGAVEYLFSRPENNCLAPLNWYQAQSAAGWHNWILLQPPSQATYGEPNYDVVSKLVTQYLQYLCRQRLQLPVTPQRVQAVLQSLHAWFRTVHRKGFDLNAASAMLTASGTIAPHEAFLELVHKLSSASTQPLTQPATGVNMLWVDLLAVRRELGLRGGIDLDVLAIGHSLETSGKGLYDADANRMGVDAAWWHTRLKAIEAVDTCRLKLVN